MIVESVITIICFLNTNQQHKEALKQLLSMVKVALVQTASATTRTLSWRRAICGAPLTTWPDLAT